jgi:hypothetical protein
MQKSSVQYATPIRSGRVSTQREKTVVAMKNDVIEVVHHCPEDGHGNTPCCARTPFELPRDDRMSNDPALVTCRPTTFTLMDNADMAVSREGEDSGNTDEE